ncbi:MAG: DUF697 domain-containing protein [Planctomycetes bacterium]|nr:DUF697 domain-containing protein [Planctomycetota bacterium]
MTTHEPDAPRELILERAKTSLAEVIASLELDPADRARFADHVREVETMMRRLEEGVIHVAVFGMVSRGKSALLNALIGREVFEVGPTHGTTRERQSVRWEPRLETVAGGAVRSFSAASDAGPTVELIDTPGLNEIGGEARAQLAEQIARRADLLLFVVSGDMVRPELEALAELRKLNKPIILVFNMIDLYPEADRQKIHDKIRGERVRDLLAPDDVVLAAARPRAAKVLMRQADGTTAETWETPPPLVTPLKLKMLEVLEREGQALAALNSMLFLDDLNEQIVRRRMELRDAAADSLVWRFTLAKAAAVACNPVAVADVAGGVATDIAMVFALARLYGIPMTRVGVGRLVVEIGKMAGLFTATEVGTHFLIGAAKSFFAATTLLTGGATAAAYASVAPIQAFAAGYGSRVIGEATKIYLRNGASWGPAGPRTVVQHILDSLDRESILARIREELRARWRPT